MEIHEITCCADADTHIAEYVRNVKFDTNLLEELEEKIENWIEEFEKLERQVKFRADENMNHYALNKIIGLHFLISTAEFYLKKWKEEKIDNNVPVFDENKNLRDHYTEEQNKLWDEDSLFDSEPE